MRVNRVVIVLAALFAVFLQGQTTSAPALTGSVVSTEEGAMEGVLVTAKKAGSTISVTVVSDAQGRYSFPASRLDPGPYSLKIRATGYELQDPGPIEVASAKTATADLKLQKTRDITTQLTNTEWIMSVPGAQNQKAALLNCVNCHTLTRVIKSKHDGDEFLQVVKRMQTYANQSTPLKVQKRKADRTREAGGEQRDRTQRALADYLATINLGKNATLPFDVKTLPRPKGAATRMIVTEYDLPRATIQPHDAILDREGQVWYSNFGEQEAGRLDPKTGKVTEYKVPELKPGFPVGELALRSDAEGMLWFGMMFQGGIARLDPKTGQFQTWNIPAEYNHDPTQINMVSPERSKVDGKIWTQNNGYAVIHHMDLATGKFETFDPFPNMKPGESHNIYDIIPDSHNNIFFLDFQQEHVGKIDAVTGKISLWPTPTKTSAPRRGQMDSQDRLWFGEYRGNHIGMFDTKTETFKEWEAPTPWSAPYDVYLDKNGDAWTGSMTSDRVLRLNTKTGQFTEYLLPRSTNIRRVFIDESTTPVTFWVGNNHGASILKLEPLE